ncbi:hypothetical protein NL676_018462 [Syzygium grande]|nr:hypothetical protein NL676_018462 [Syzygium grande]
MNQEPGPIDTRHTQQKRKTKKKKKKKKKIYGSEVDDVAAETDSCGAAGREGKRSGVSPRVGSPLGRDPSGGGVRVNEIGERARSKPCLGLMPLFCAVQLFGLNGRKNQAGCSVFDPPEGKTGGLRMSVSESLPQHHRGLDSTGIIITILSSARAYDADHRSSRESRVMMDESRALVQRAKDRVATKASPLDWVGDKGSIRRDESLMEQTNGAA